MLTWILISLLCGDLDRVSGEVNFWSAAEQQGHLINGEVVEGEAFAHWRIENDIEERVTIPILVWERPDIQAQVYMIRGRIRTSGIRDGYLEMWSHFTGGGQYFTRTQADTGPMARLGGDTDWREFQLPFNRGETLPKLEKLEINLIISGRGTVDIGPLDLVGAGGATTDWTGVGMAIVGVLLGILGSVVGVLSSKGKARPVVTVALILIAVAGLILAGFGIWSWRGGGNPVLVAGAVVEGLAMVGLALGLGPVVSRRYRELEMRRMHALDQRLS